MGIKDMDINLPLNESPMTKLQIALFRIFISILDQKLLKVKFYHFYYGKNSTFYNFTVIE